MKDDLLGKLREKNNDCEFCVSWHLINEAADEIERLRSECHRWQEIADSLVSVFSNEKTKEALVAWAEAVRNER